MAKNPIQLPSELSGKFRFTQPMYGGPVFDFPKLNLWGINLATLSESMANRLVDAGWPGIQRIPAEKQKGNVPDKTEV